MHGYIILYVVTQFVLRFERVRAQAIIVLSVSRGALMMAETLHRVGGLNTMAISALLC
jgi:NhaP-type Na+/H+ or K+/H+ antiporter